MVVRNVLSKLPFSDFLIYTQQVMSIADIYFSRKLDIPSSVEHEAEKKDFEIAGYQFTAQREQTRQPRIVRVGIIQNKIILPTSAPITQQVMNSYTCVVSVHEKINLQANIAL